MHTDKRDTVLFLRRNAQIEHTFDLVEVTPEGEHFVFEKKALPQVASLFEEFCRTVFKGKNV